MINSQKTDHEILLSCLIIDNNLIDKSISSGLTENHFTEPWQVSIFNKILKVRSKGGVVDITSLASEGIPYADIITVSDVSITTYHYASSLDRILWAYSKGQIGSLCAQAKEATAGNGSSDDERRKVGVLVSQMQAWIADKQDTARTCEEIGAEVEQWAQEIIAGKPDNRVKVEWPLKVMNDTFGPIMPNELCCIGARPKECKTTTALQTIGHNLKRGLKMAYFTLESSDSDPFKIIAAQMAKIDLRNLDKAPRENQQDFIKYIKKLRASKNLAIFDKDMNILTIEARCRMLKASMKPDFIVLDHLHLIQNDFGDRQYEKITDTVNRLIELRKYMGCAIILCLQLNRSNVTAERAPRASDAKDSGAIEAAAWRMVIPYRPPNDFNDQPQTGISAQNKAIFDFYFIQDICRDGPTGSVRLQYLAPIATFTQLNK